MTLLRLLKFKLLLLCIWLLGANTPLGAFHLIDASKQLRLAVIFNQEPPFFYTDENNLAKGIVPSLANALSRELGLELLIVPAPRKNIEKAIITEQADIALMPIEWANYTDLLIFSESVMTHNDYFYSLSPFDERVGPKEWLKDKTVCVRQDYQYPVLYKFFEQGYGQAKFVSGQVPLLKLLEMGGCDLLFMSEDRAQWMKSTLNLSTPIWQSPQALEKTEMTFMLDRKYRDVMPRINQALAKIKQSGELDSILQSFKHPIKAAK